MVVYTIELDFYQVDEQGINADFYKCTFQQTHVNNMIVQRCQLENWMLNVGKPS